MSVTLQRLWIQLTADRKRFGVLCVTLAVGLLLWARIIIISNVPRAAVAEEKAASRSEESRGVRSQPLSGRSDGLGAAGERERSQRVLGRPVVLETAPVRDPFVISTRHFPKPSSDGAMRAEQSKSGPNAAEIAEQAKAHQLAGLVTLASRFRLEAVMTGESGPRATDAIAVISGRTWKRGDTLPAVGNAEMKFTLVEIRHRSVLLKFDEHIFELHMPTPGR